MPGSARGQNNGIINTNALYRKERSDRSSERSIVRYPAWTALDTSFVISLSFSVATQYKNPSEVSRMARNPPAISQPLEDRVKAKSICLNIVNISVPSD